MNSMAQRYFGTPPVFDLEKGKTVIQPEGKGYGYWVGGHSVVYDPDGKKFYLYYRIRSPLGMGRGAKCRIAESTDGIKFTDIWEATKEELDAESIEVGSLIRDPASGNWRLYISYEIRGGLWRVDLVESDSLRSLDAVHHRTVMQPQDYGLTSVKDPRIYIVGGLYMAFVCVPARQRWTEDASGTRHPAGFRCNRSYDQPRWHLLPQLQVHLRAGAGSPRGVG